MRDSTVMGMHQANARRNAMMLGQFEFIKTRQEAIERVVKVSSLWDRIGWFIDPSRLIAVVDAVQINLLNDAKRKMQEASAKPHIEVVHA